MFNRSNEVLTEALYQTLGHWCVLRWKDDISVLWEKKWCRIPFLSCTTLVFTQLSLLRTKFQMVPLKSADCDGWGVECEIMSPNWRCCYARKWAESGFVLLVGAFPSISLDLLTQLAYKEYLVVEIFRKEGGTVIQLQLCPRAIQYLQTSRTWQSW